VENVILKSLVELRNNISKMISTFIKKTDWQPELPKYETIDQALEYMKAFCEGHYRWKADPVYGLLDNVYSIKHLNWQLKNKGIIEGDCDDLATYSCYMALRIFGCKAYRVNIISMLHVICVFELKKAQTSEYHSVSNQDVDMQPYGTLEECIKAYTESANETTVIENLALKDQSSDRVVVA